MFSCGICLNDFEDWEYILVHEMPCCKTEESTKIMCSFCVANTYAINMQKHRHNCCFCRQTYPSFFISKMQMEYKNHFTDEERRQIEVYWHDYSYNQLETQLTANNLRILIEGFQTTRRRRKIAESTLLRRAEASKNAIWVREIQKNSKIDEDFKDSLEVFDCFDEESNRTYELMSHLRKREPQLFNKKNKFYY